MFVLQTTLTDLGLQEEVIAKEKGEGWGKGRQGFKKSDENNKIGILTLNKKLPSPNFWSLTSKKMDLLFLRSLNVRWKK